MNKLKKSSLKRKISTLLTETANTIASFNVLFQCPDNMDFRINDGIEEKDILNVFSQTVRAIVSDLHTLDENPDTAVRRRRIIDTGADSVDFINMLFDCLRGKKLSDVLEAGILNVLIAEDLYGKLEGDLSVKCDERLMFQVKHAERLCRCGIKVIKGYIRLLEEIDSTSRGIVRMYPVEDKLDYSKRLFAIRNNSLSARTVNLIKEKAYEIDPFREGRAFRYLDDMFEPGVLSSIRPVDKFYGYLEARAQLKSFFKSFADSKSNLPLFITSLPGLGKTQMTIANTLHNENLILILPEPSTLEKPLEKLFRNLASRKNHQFVVFFDDVDPRNINWYYFRTHVGGSFALPENIAVVIASNYEFPANILSRGRGFTFPVFDEDRCQEMVHDFLMSMHMKSPSDDLVSIIAADYVEEFGQKVFEELSPRTLVRYLERYEKDINKRKRMLELSKEEVVAKPDPECFFDVNLKLMRALYGEEVITRLREEREAPA